MCSSLVRALLREGRLDLICARAGNKEAESNRSPHCSKPEQERDRSTSQLSPPAPLFSQGFAQLSLHVALISVRRQQHCFKLWIAVHRKKWSSQQAHCHGNESFPPLIRVLLPVRRCATCLLPGDLAPLSAGMPAACGRRRTEATGEATSPQSISRAGCLHRATDPKRWWGW